MAEASDRILKILLQLRADTAGAQQTTTALKEVQTQAAETSTTVGNIGASSSGLASLVGATLVGGFVAAGAAAFALYKYIDYTTEAQKRLNEEVLRQNQEIDRAVTQWTRLAEKAENLGDQVKIGDKAEAELNKLSDKMAEFRRQQIDAFSTWGQSTESLIRDILTLGGHIPGISTQTFGQQEAAAMLAVTQRSVAVAVRDANIHLNLAAEKTREWAAATANLPKGIEFYTQKVAEAQKKLDDITAKTQASPTDKNLLGIRQDALRELDDAQHKLESLTSTQAKLASESEKVGEAVRKADFAQMDPAHKLEELNTETLALQSKLLELGVAAESPNQAFAKASELINAGTLATKEDQQAALSLVGAWAQVVGMISQALAAQSRMAGEVASLQQHLATVNATAYGTRDEAYKAEWGEKYNKILEQRQKIGASTDASEINAQIAAEEGAAERKKTWAEEDRASGGVASNQKEITAQTREQSALLAQIRFNQQVIEQNPFLSVDQKQTALLQSYQQEMQQLGAEIQKQRSFIANTALDPAQLEQARAKLQQMGHEVTLLGQKMQTLTFGGALRGELTSWVNSFGTAAHQVAGVITGTLNTAIGSTSQALTALIFKTGNWKQAFAQAAQSIVQNIIQVALQFVVSRLVMAAINRVVGTTEGSAATAQGSAAAAAWAPAATSASIASYGAASGVGVAAYIAALAAGTAGATAASGVGGLAGGLAEGGRVSGSPSTRDNVVMGMATGETVISAPASTWADSYYGPNWHFDMNAMRVPVPRGLAEGGRVGNFSSISNYNTSQSQSGGDTHVFVVMNEDELRKRLLASDAGRKIVIDHFRGRRLDLGIS